MSKSSPPNPPNPVPGPGASAAQKQGTFFRAFRSPEANSDWLASSLTTAKMVTAGAECIPFPYVKGAFGMVVVILETVEVRYFFILEISLMLCSQKVKKNRDDLKELCDSIMEIVRIVQGQLSAHANTTALEFKRLCEELERWPLNFLVSSDE
jgi:hypothetical protein